MHMALLLYQIDNLQLGTKKASSKSFLSDLEPGDGWIWEEEREWKDHISMDPGHLLKAIFQLDWKLRLAAFPKFHSVNIEN